jgi:hypothetical protein
LNLITTLCLIRNCRSMTGHLIIRQKLSLNPAHQGV